MDIVHEVPEAEVNFETGLRDTTSPTVLAGTSAEAMVNVEAETPTATSPKVSAGTIAEAVVSKVTELPKDTSPKVVEETNAKCGTIGVSTSPSTIDKCEDISASKQKYVYGNS
jgi:hypothetical protein